MKTHETHFDTLIEPKELAAHLRDAGWIVMDCRFELSKPAAGREAYARAHIPGARYAHLDEDLSSPVTPATGRHPLPDIDSFVRRLADWGIGADTQVVAYDEANGAFAARLWWLLRWLGSRKVAVLNGGFKAWRAAGFEIEQGTEPARQTNKTMKAFQPRPEAGAWLRVDEVEHELSRGNIALIDARGADRFAGQNETIDPVAGHVPGAINHPFPTSLDADQRFLPPEQLRERWSQTLGTTPATQAVSMCGSGVTACHNLLALEIAGLRGARLYAGSWSEWIRDPRRGVAR